MARPKKSEHELTKADIKKGISLARKLMDTYSDMLENPEKPHPEVKTLEAIGKYLDQNGITLNNVMQENTKKTAKKLSEESTNTGTKKSKSGSAKGAEFQPPFIDGKPNPKFKDDTPKGTKMPVSVSTDGGGSLV